MSEELITPYDMAHGNWSLPQIIVNPWVQMGIQGKEKSDGSIDCFNAQLVTKGYNQCHGLDYKEICILIVKPATN